MGLSRLAPSRVYQHAALLNKTRPTTFSPPPWFETIGAIPPSEILTRTQPIQHRDTNLNSKVRKPSKMFKPQFIVYEEDRIRQTFYRDHPWELARPRIVLEEDGKDGQKCDWSKIQQDGKRLSGESVVQRQLWLLQNAQGITNAQAYDIARKEFYALRHEEEVERRVTKEEALSTGAYFGKSVLEIGMQLEDKIYEQWKDWATTEVETIERQKASAYTGIGTQNEDVAVESTTDAEPEEEEAQP
ncbi:37S ribosomal protein Rsm25 [Phlyctema vagabunda]|uniref:37S ribosomal protein S25, mitochondrial n=1 Tax=Phlyctema vagabunda TaxID=108571 RepID=A0ABR4PWF7_9HELO